LLYVLICDDKPDSESLRKSVRDQHLEYLQGYDVRFAGPMLAEDATTMIGSIIVIDVEDEATARQFAASDPYGTAGLFASVTIRPFKQVIP
jgi:uncharacterized protein